MQKDMQQIIVGSYYLGDESVQLVLREGVGGEAYASPEKGHIARIRVGADYKFCKQIVDTLLHEAFEFTFFRMGCRYDSDWHCGHANDSYLFVANHAQFTEACGRVGEFIDECLPDLVTAWKRYKRDKKK